MAKMFLAPVTRRPVAAGAGAAATAVPVAGNSRGEAMAGLRSLSRWVLVAACVMLAAPALAQTADTQGLVAKIQQLERDLITLQRYVYGGWKRPKGEAAAAEPAARAITPIQIAHLQIRITEFETELRNLTGSIEEMGFKLDKVHARLNKLVGDVDVRLTALERDLAQSLEAMAPAPVPTPTAAEAEEEGAEVAAAPASPEPAPSEPGLAPGPRTIATITATDLAALRERAAAPPEPETILPEGTSQERYNFAVGKLRQGDWGEAQKAFDEFVTSHPDDGLVANARYWLGETFYVREQFEEAAATFLEGYQKHPEGPKAPDSLLKLGMSLARLGEDVEACRTFAEVLKKHADAPTSIIRLVEKERQRVGCS